MGYSLFLDGPDAAGKKPGSGCAGRTVLSEQERDIVAELRKKSDETGLEQGRAICDGKISEMFPHNSENGVEVPETILQQKYVYLYHSHTNVTPFSAKDLGFLARENVEKVCVITKNQDVFCAYIGSGYKPSLKEYNEVKGAIDIGDE